jgi:hypothetical protein
MQLLAGFMSVDTFSSSYHVTEGAKDFFGRLVPNTKNRSVAYMFRRSQRQDM